MPQKVNFCRSNFDLSFYYFFFNTHSLCEAHSNIPESSLMEIYMTPHLLLTQLYQESVLLKK